VATRNTAIDARAKPLQLAVFVEIFPDSATCRDLENFMSIANMASMPARNHSSQYTAPEPTHYDMRSMTHMPRSATALGWNKRMGRAAAYRFPTLRGLPVAGRSILTRPCRRHQKKRTASLYGAGSGAAVMSFYMIPNLDNDSFWTPIRPYDHPETGRYVWLFSILV